jgi:hypothetical protein
MAAAAAMRRRAHLVRRPEMERIARCAPRGAADGPPSRARLLRAYAAGAAAAQPLTPFCVQGELLLLMLGGIGDAPSSGGGRRRSGVSGGSSSSGA